MTGVVACHSRLNDAMRFLPSFRGPKVSREFAVARGSQTGPSWASAAAERVRQTLERPLHNAATPGRGHLPTARERAESSERRTELPVLLMGE